MTRAGSVNADSARQRFGAANIAACWRSLPAGSYAAGAWPWGSPGAAEAACAAGNFAAISAKGRSDSLRRSGVVEVVAGGQADRDQARAHPGEHRASLHGVVVLEMQCPGDSRDARTTIRRSARVAWPLRESGPGKVGPLLR